jgi:hypothetical protein
MVLHRYQEVLKTFDHLSTRKYWVVALSAGCHARLGNMDHARVLAAECLLMKPDLSISHRMTKEAFKKPSDTVHLAASLNMAGLPE